MKLWPENIFLVNYGPQNIATSLILLYRYVPVINLQHLRHEKINDFILQNGAKD
jgi:hypothetical protein